MGEGFLHGADTVGSAVVRGVTGVFTEPIRGAEQAGVEGFVKGVAKGAVGLIVKPLVGAADAVSDGLQGSLLDMTAGQGVFAQRAVSAICTILPFLVPRSSSPHLFLFDPPLISHSTYHSTLVIRLSSSLVLSHLGSARHARSASAGSCSPSRVRTQRCSSSSR